MVAKTLTPRQREILQFIKNYYQEHHCSPTYAEIAAAVGLSSMATIFTHIKALERKGYLRRQKGTARGIEILAQDEPVTDSTLQIPLLGFISGSSPLEELSDQDAKIDVLPARLVNADINSCFALQVKGNHLLSEGLLGGDFVIFEYTNKVQNGEIALVVLEKNIATIRRVLKQHGQFQLESLTDPLQKIYMQQPKIQGRLLYAFRVFAKS